MAKSAPRRGRGLAIAFLGLVLVLGVATGAFWGDLMRTSLDPKTPFQTYKPPPAPDYAQRESWWLMPARPDAPGRADPPADVFFVSPTTFDGGRHWNGPVQDPKADRLFRQVMAPNYAGPFARVGRIFAPKYRQASLYSYMALREDAREARAFPYRDVSRAFRKYLADYNQGRPLVIVGVEQGAVLTERLLAEAVAEDPSLRDRLAVVYLMETAAAADYPPIPPCRRRGEAGCLAAWASVHDGEFQRAQILLDRALVWGPGGELVNLDDRPALCFNPLLHSVTDAPAPARLNLGAANATGLEWGARPGFLARQVSAQCRGGVLHVSRPKSASLQPQGDWAGLRRVPPYNLFYADLEADAQERVAALLGKKPEAAAEAS